MSWSFILPFAFTIATTVIVSYEKNAIFNMFNICFIKKDIFFFHKELH